MMRAMTGHNISAPVAAPEPPGLAVLLQRAAVTGSAEDEAVLMAAAVALTDAILARRRAADKRL